MTNTPAKALILDDDADFLVLLERLLNSLNVAADCCPTYECLAASLGHDPDVIFLDIMMPVTDGVQVIQRLAKLNVDAPLVLMSGGDPAVLDAASRYARLEGMRVAGVLQKPFWTDQLAALLDSIAGWTDRQFGLLPSLTSGEVGCAIEEKRLLVHYQPKIDHHGGGVFGLEALARLLGDDGKIIYPHQFMASMESTELMTAFAARILDCVLSDLVLFRDQGLIFNAAINVGINLLEKGCYPDVVQQACKKYGIPTNSLTLEITERSITENVKTVLRVATRLRILGMGLSIDDFGTSFSSVERLRNLPFSELKIDRSLVAAATKDANVLARCADIVQMGRQLKLAVVAEGVENEIELDAMIGAGCRYFQGFYFARPMSAAELPFWITNRDERF